MVGIGQSSPCGSMLAPSPSHTLSTTAIRYCDTCTAYGIVARNPTVFRRFRTFCALIRRPRFQSILEEVATALLVLFAVWDRIISWSCCLVVTMCLGDLFMSMTFQVTSPSGLTLEWLDGAYWILQPPKINIMDNSMNIFILNDVFFFKYFVNYKFPILICSNNNVPICKSTQQPTFPLHLTAHHLSCVSSFCKLNCWLLNNYLYHSPIGDLDPLP